MVKWVFSLLNFLNWRYMTNKTWCNGMYIDPFRIDTVSQKDKIYWNFSFLGPIRTTLQSACTPQQSEWNLRVSKSRLQGQSLFFCFGSRLKAFLGLCESAPSFSIESNCAGKFQEVCHGSGAWFVNRASCLWAHVCQHVLNWEGYSLFHGWQQPARENHSNGAGQCLRQWCWRFPTRFCPWQPYFEMVSCAVLVQTPTGQHFPKCCWHVCNTCKKCWTLEQ